jgi:anti-sigma28 factor (negative regulator of flagellin synthesis)
MRRGGSPLSFDRRFKLSNPKAQRDHHANRRQEPALDKGIKEFLATLPDMRNEKVSLLREKIETGTYAVDYAGVAGKLVNAFIEDLL